VADDGGTDWAGYYAWSAGREPRPLLLAACEELGAGQDRLAFDLGCGEGTDALELLARGWLVLGSHSRDEPGQKGKPTRPNWRWCQLAGHPDVLSGRLQVVLRSDLDVRSRSRTGLAGIGPNRPEP